MIIIGLLIGGIFGGMKLVDNANVQKTIQDIKAIESAALTFKDTYRALPGDIRNPNTRIPNCTVAPCATTGDGNRIIGTAILGEGLITAASENFTFWHHLAAANLVSMGYSNTLDTNTGEGQPEVPIGGAYRISDWNTGVGGCPTNLPRTGLHITGASAAATTPTDWVTSCASIRSVDIKMDDGTPDMGSFVMGWNCVDANPVCTRNYTIAGNGVPLYDLKGF
jgi:hypothetical protein